MASSPSYNELAYRTAGELADELAQKRVSATELVDAAIDRIEALDGKINAVVVRDFERPRRPPTRRWPAANAGRCSACR
jgi:Asp-tRNA(Asn)/Glu-tRNA(Gln) amidotransferase A subunit family amidase